MTASFSLGCQLSSSAWTSSYFQNWAVTTTISFPIPSILYGFGITLRVVEVSWSEWCQWGHSQELRLYRCITRTLCRFFHDLLHGEIYPMHSLQWVFSPALLFLPKPVKLVLIRISPVSQIRKFQGFLFLFVCLFVRSFALLCFAFSQVS